MNKLIRLSGHKVHSGILAALFCTLALNIASAGPPVEVIDTSNRAEFRQIEFSITAADGSEHRVERQVPALSAAQALSATIQAIDYDQMATPDVIVGTAIANGEFTTDRRNGIELALRGALRFNAQGDPENTFNSNGDGSYSFDAGQAPGQSPQTPVWSFHWSVNSDFDNSSGLNLDDLVYEMGLDGDPGLGTDFLVFDPLIPPSGLFFDHAIGDNTTPNGGGTVATSAGEYLSLLANNHVAQNAWRYDFFPVGSLAGFDPEADGRYNVYLSAIDPGTDEVLAHVEIVFLIGDAPAEVHVQSTTLTNDTPTATDNDFTRIDNAIAAATSDSVITLEGTFDWTEAHAMQSWVDADYGSMWASGVHRVTITAAALGDAIIQGPGDVPDVWYEGVFYATGPNQGWEISNLTFFDFDVPIGMFYGGGGANIFDDTRIINNHIRTSTDLATEDDDFQNIAIHYSLGDNQLIAGNLIEIPGDGVSDPGAEINAATVGIQSNTGGVTTYEGLVIEDNVIRVLNAQSAEPEHIVGIWENGGAHNRNIIVRNNVFENLATGNDPLLNRQQGFRIHSQSSLTTTALYEGNSVAGANVAYHWLPASYGAGLNREPVVFNENEVIDSHIGVRLDSNGAGIFRDNDFSGADIGIQNATTGPRVSDATCNWWGHHSGPSGEGPGVGAEVDENLLYAPWNSSPGGACDGQFIIPDTVYVDDDYAGLPPGTAVSFTLADSSTVNATIGYDAFAVLADGISAAANSGTVYVASGDYPGERLVIDKQLVIEGVGDKPVIRPDQDMTGSAASAAWILVEEGAVLVLYNVALDGDGHLVHYALRSHGEVVVVDRVDFRNIRGSLSGSPYQGTAIASFGGQVAGGVGAGTYTETFLLVSESSFEQLGRIGVLIKGSESLGVIQDSVFSGKGDGDFLDYAVEVGAEGNGIVLNNTISNHRGIASSDGSTSAGVLVTSFWGVSESEAIIVNNNLIDNSHGIAVGYGDDDANHVTIEDNDFIGNRYQLSVSYDDFDLVEDTLANNTFDRTVVVRDNPIAVPVIYGRIQDAIDAASDGQIVDVSPGNYPESLLVNVPNLNLLGAQAGVPVAGRSAGDAAESTIDGQGGSHALNIAAAGVRVDGFSVTTTSGTTMGIGETTSLNDTEVANNFVSGFTSSIGINLAAGSSDSRIQGNHLSDVYAGIYLSANASGATVNDNHIEGLAAGAGPDQGAAIVFEGNNSDVSISDNTLSDNAFGVYVWDGYGSDFSGTAVFNNSITGNASGVTNTNPALIEASCNWWGDESGPGNIGSGDPVVGNVSFEPWNTAPGGPCEGTAIVLQGTVGTLGYCSENPALLEGALISAEGSLGGSFSTSSDDNGFYQLIIHGNESPLDVTISYANHASESFQVNYAGGGLINGDTQLILAEPCATVMPESLSINLDAGSSIMGQVDLGNVNGAVPLIWTIDTANALADLLRPDPAEAISGEREPATDSAVISSAAISLTQAELAEFVQPVLESGPTLSVDGMTASDGYGSGDPYNSFVNLNIGVGNALTGIAWEVVIEAFTPSWLDDSRLAIVTSAGDTSGLFLAPGGGMTGSGAVDFSSGGLLMLADVSIPPVQADSNGNLYFEWFETWVDFPGAPDSLWMNSASPQVTLPGLRLICEDQAACDAAVGGEEVVHCLDPVGVPWLHPEPIFGMTAAGAITSIDLTLDASTLQPGEYHAGLCVASNDPVKPILPFPVSLNVRAPDHFYNIQGTVRSLGHCSDNSAPLEAALLQFTGSAGNQIFYTEADGSYDVYLNPDNAPYSLTVSHAGHLSDTESGLNSDAVIDFDLVLDASCIHVDPDSVSMSLLADSSDTAEVTISNLGAASLDWQLDENPARSGLLLKAAAATIPETLPAEGSGGLSRSAHEQESRLVSMPDAASIPNADEIVLTHSASQDIVLLNTVACSSDGGISTVENAFLRSFTLGDFGISTDFDVSEISFGIEELSAASNVDVNLYTLDGPLIYANMTLIGTSSAALEPSQSETVVTVPVTGDVPAGGTLVVEILAPDMNGIGRFYAGSNGDGETAPSYLAAADCGLDDPATYASIGFNDIHLVMSVIGTVPVDCSIPDWISSIAPASGSLTPSASEPLTMILDATGLAVDTYAASVCLSSNDSFAPVKVIAVELNVLERDPAVLLVDPDELDFGEVQLGNEVSLSVTVSNQADPEAEALTLDSLAVIGGSDFSVSGGDCALGTVLEPGESCLLEVSFAPSLVGLLVDQAEVIAGSQQAVVELTGIGIVLEPGTLEFDQPMLDFGTVSLGQSATQILVLSNSAPSGHAAVELDSISVVGSADFAESANGSCQPGQTVLEPGDSCTVEISFSPTADGNVNATLLAEGVSGELASASLSGSGSEEPPEDAIFSDRFEEAADNG